MQKPSKQIFLNIHGGQLLHTPIQWKNGVSENKGLSGALQATEFVKFVITIVIILRKENTVEPVFPQLLKV